jgi:hypothetical protein
MDANLGVVTRWIVRCERDYERVRGAVGLPVIITPQAAFNSLTLKGTL